MVDASIDVAGIGNAIVDVLAQADDGFVSAQDLSKGTMNLIDEARADRLYAAMGPGREVSGGSAANTIAGVAHLGGTGAFIGKVRDDELGKIFRHDIRAAEVGFETAPTVEGPPTARCLILVTPDANRTLCTFLGACLELGPEDVDETVIAGAKVSYLEGYLWDPPRAKEAFLKTAKVAHDAGRQTALTLSDPFCVDRSLYQVDSFDAALQEVRGRCRVAALTRSEKGAVILGDGEVHVVDAEPVERVVDTTGAGDLFAAGFLFGYTHGHGLYDCGRMGAIAAAEIIESRIRSNARCQTHPFCATSPSSPTWTMARPPWWISCCASPGLSGTTSGWPSGRWTPTTRSASGASPSWPNAPRSPGGTTGSTSWTPPGTPTSAARWSGSCPWWTGCCCWWTPPRGPCPRPSS
jgi:sugar/nucleoside kinase (ribokinase family)